MEITYENKRKRARHRNYKVVPAKEYEVRKELIHSVLESFYSVLAKGNWSGRASFSRDCMLH